MNKKIKQMRRDADMSHDELARKLGISRSSVMNFERAPYDNFSIHTLKRIAQIFDVNLVAHFEEKEPTEPISLIADED